MKAWWRKFHIHWFGKFVGYGEESHWYMNRFPWQPREMIYRCRCGREMRY